MRRNSIELQKDDPLKRIQEEINEVARREQELRELNNNHHNENSNNDNDIDNGNHTDTVLNRSDQSNDTSTISDDSGISSSSSPINGTSANVKELKYIRSNTINPTSSQIQQKQQQQQYSVAKLTRAMSTPQIFIPAKRFSINTSSQKGIMQRFIASRGKIAAASTRKFNNDNILTSAELNRSSFINPMIDLSPPIIERDENGRPLRKGYVPVGEKIQKELREMKTRESELKQLRRKHNTLRQSQPNLTADDDEINGPVDEYESDSDNDEHCFGPQKLQSSKSISELCDTLNNNNLDSRNTPSPHLYQRNGSIESGGSLRPAVSLAQLCDIDPEETPSSHRLIAQWENIIQQQQQQEVV